MSSLGGVGEWVVRAAKVVVVQGCTLTFLSASKLKNFSSTKTNLVAFGIVIGKGENTKSIIVKVEEGKM